MAGSCRFSELIEFFRNNQPVAVLTGAGCSTASGIPDYRDSNGEWKQKQPIQFREFVEDKNARKRYWLRSMLGWPRFQNAQPNSIHLQLASLQKAGWVNGVITQNVDGLHRQASQEQLIELHGRLDHVRCLNCDSLYSRELLQTTLVEQNYRFIEKIQDREVKMAADGDAFFEPENIHNARVPECLNCSGLLKPDVVFFGETVPPARVAESFSMLNKSKALLVIGSSLMIFSGFRFPRFAHANDYPLAIVNRGVTRADDLAHLKINQDCGEVLSAIHQELTGYLQ